MTPPVTLFDEEETNAQLMTMYIGDRILAIPVSYVRDVLYPQKITPTPLVPPEIVGVMNLRGHIVTVMDIRNRLKLPPLSADQKTMFVVIENEEEFYSLIVDKVGDVLTIPSRLIEQLPMNLPDYWHDIAKGVYQLESNLLIILDPKLLFVFV
jgi:purine-binding chemotaxis protein CheW